MTTNDNRKPIPRSIPISWGGRSPRFTSCAVSDYSRMPTRGFFEYEMSNEVVWAGNDFVGRTLGREPVTVRAWLQEHAQGLLT